MRTAKFFQTRASLFGGLFKLGREVGGFGWFAAAPTLPNSSFTDYVP